MNSCIIEIAEERDEKGWWAKCKVHGHLGYEDKRVDVFLVALEHDFKHGGDTAQ